MGHTVPLQSIVGLAFANQALCTDSNDGYRPVCKLLNILGMVLDRVDCRSPEFRFTCSKIPSEGKYLKVVCDAFDKKNRDVRWYFYVEKFPGNMLFTKIPALVMCYLYDSQISNTV